MFLFAPPVQPVLPIWSKKDVYFPVRRLIFRQQEQSVALPEDMLFCIADGQTETIDLAQEQWQVQTVLAAAFGVDFANQPHNRLTDSIWGWAAGVLLRPADPTLFLQSHLVVSFLKPHTAAPKPVSVETWLYRNNDKLLAVTSPSEKAFCANCAHTVAQVGSLVRGDVLLTATSPSVVVASSETIYAGVSGVGSIKIQLR